MRAAPRILALIGILLAGAPASARADWLLTPFIGLTFQGQTTLLDSESAVGKAHWSFGGTISFAGAGPLGVEGLILYTPGFFQQDDPPAIGGVPAPDVIESRSLAVMGNVVLTTPRKWTEYGLRPFVSGGIGLLRASAKDSFDILPVETNLLGYNVGGGAIGPLTERTGLRLDLRYFSNLQPSDSLEAISIGRVQLSYWTASVGFVIKY